MTIYSVPNEQPQHSGPTPFTQANAPTPSPATTTSNVVTPNDLFILFQELLQSNRSTQSNTSSSRLNIELPKFFGRPNESLSMWLFQVESAFATRSIFGVDRFPYLSSCLGEAALSWLHNWHMSARAGLTHTFTHWEEFVINIRQAFEPPRQQQLLRTQLRALKQTSTAQSYTFAFRTIMGQITRMDEEDRLAYYVHGLNSKLRGEVEVREPRDLEDAIKIAITFDQIRQNSQINYAPVQTEPLGNNSRPQNQNHGSKFTRNIQPVPMELGNISPKTKAARFRDKKPDYYTKFCSKCSRYGHTDAECRTHPANTEAKKLIYSKRTSAKLRSPQTLRLWDLQRNTSRIIMGSPTIS